MATIWTLASTKGGCGKTTLTAIIASEITKSGGQVAVLDTDKNTPLLRWADKGLLPAAVTVHDVTDPSGRALTNKISELRGSKTFVLIDTEGTQNVLTGLAIQHSSVVVIPMKWSELDATEALKVKDFVSVASQATGRTIPSVLVPSQVDAAIESKAQRDIKSKLGNDGTLWVDPPVLNKSAYVAMFDQGRLLQDIEMPKGSKSLITAQDNAHAVVQAIARAAVEFARP
jgi:chromosome partitioning protein